MSLPSLLLLFIFTWGWGEDSYGNKKKLFSHKIRKFGCYFQSDERIEVAATATEATISYTIPMVTTVDSELDGNLQLVFSNPDEAARGVWNLFSIKSVSIPVPVRDRDRCSTTLSSDSDEFPCLEYFYGQSPDDFNEANHNLHVTTLEHPTPAQLAIKLSKTMWKHDSQSFLALMVAWKETIRYEILSCVHPA